MFLELSSAFFARNAVRCLNRAVSTESEFLSGLWLRFATDDFRMCIRKAREEGRYEPYLTIIPPRRAS